MTDPLRDQFDRWKAETLAKSKARMPEQPERTVTVSGQPVDTLYGPEHLHDEAACREYLDKIGFPGEYREQKLL